MHDDSEVIQKKLFKLLQSLIPDISLTDVEAVGQELDKGLGDLANPDLSGRGSEAADFLPLQDTSSISSSHHGAETVPNQRATLFELGEIPAVQDRFYSLLKQRLQTEIQQNPPLFPWETDIQDYETEAASYGMLHANEAAEVDTVAAQRQVPAWLWINQLKSLNLPVPMPETILNQLLQRCQDVAHSTLLEGAKLVRAVEDLFPGQSQALNHLAGLVMTSAAPARSPETATNTHYPASYEAAIPAQQMVLSLLAAKEIISSLTLTLSPNQPKVDRQWIAQGGVLTLTAEYESDFAFSRLRIQSSLPCGGSLMLGGNEGIQAKTERPTAGYLSVELIDPEPNQTYSLEVRLTEKDPDPLVFAVRIIEE